MSGLPIDVSCPVCHGSMEPGTVGPAYAWHNLTLCWQGEGSGEAPSSLGERRVVRTAKGAETRPGYRCASCRLVVFKY